MSKIKGKDLLRLGFKREDNIPTSAMDCEYHYYVFETKNKKGVLISNTNDEVPKGGGYEVELYEIPEIQFTDLKLLKKLVKLLKAATK
jgi:hypothetical protein